MTEFKSLDDTDIKIDNTKNDIINEDTASFITLIPKDYLKTHQKFDVNKKYSVISKVILAAIDTEKTCAELELNVETQELKHIVDYMNIRKGDTNNIITRPVVEPYDSLIPNNATPEENTFITQFSGFENRERLQKILESSFYLDIDPLLQLASAQYSLGISKCNTPEEASKWFPDNERVVDKELEKIINE